MRTTLRRRQTSNARRLRLTTIAAALASGVLGGLGGLALNADTASAKDKVKARIQNTTLTITGTGGSDAIALRLRAGDASTLEIDAGDDASADLEFKRDRFDHIVVDAGNGDDALRIDDANGSFTDTQNTTLDGEGGDDTLTGGAGGETFIGGDGSDTITGGRGDDLALMGVDNDVFVWNPGDASDTVEGQTGADTLRFNGAIIAESFDVSANGSRVRLSRNVGSIAMDLNGVERIDLDALGGADTLTVNDLGGTDVSVLNADLSASGGGGDGQADNVIVNGTPAADLIQVTGDAAGVAVLGLAPQVNIAGAEAAKDTLTINALVGQDTVTATGLAAGVIGLRLNGGADGDLLVGSSGDDVAAGNAGDDTARLGAGDDAFVWNPGDGNDAVEGQMGVDALRFNGANIAESFDLSANGSRVRFLRNIGSVAMDLNGVERIDLKALGGADTITVNNLAGTDLTQVNADLSATDGGGDGDADSVIVNGAAGSDLIDVEGDASGVAVLGLAARLNVAGAEAARDTLTINALTGDDVVEAPALTADAIKLVVFGGEGDDVLIGGAGDDVIRGEAGDDVLIGGPGLDDLDGSPGNDIIIQD